jgi:Fe2+ or Zn2+ uptake regulation protein
MASQSTQTEEAFADGTPLMHLFGTPARTRILSVFVDEREFDLSVTEIADQAGVARSTVYDHLDHLVALGVVEQTRETGGGTRYQLNQDSDIAEYLYKLDGVTLKRLLEYDGNL